MAEEIENAAVNVPRAIVTTVLLNGSTGWAMVLAVLFCLGDIDSVIVCYLKPSSLPRDLSRNTCLITILEFPHRIPIHTSILQRSRQSWSYSNDSDCSLRNMVCCRRFCCHGKSYDMVIRERSRITISPVYSQGQYDDSPCIAF